MGGHLPFDSAGDAGGDLAALDELLQVMYWLRGEGLASEVAAADLVRWLGLEVARIEVLLQRLADWGLVQAGQTRGYVLTAAGVQEGGRRFADEFADMTRPGHGECGDPTCECQQTGNPADCVHQHRHA